MSDVRKGVEEMSDILIKGMEMPEDGVYWCEIGVAGYIATITIHGEERKSFHLVPVPPHGRLIDADALAQQYVTAQEQREKDKTDYCNAFMNNGEPCTEWWCVEDMLENAPTIIPAEDGKT